jgi:hypothetical protein
MKKTLSITILMFLSIFFLGGCYLNPKKEILNTQVFFGTTIPSLTPNPSERIPTVEVTRSLNQYQQENISPTHLATNLYVITENCYLEKKELLNYLGDNKMKVLINSQDREKNLYIYDYSTDEKIILGTSYIFFVSPDKTKIAFEDYELNTIKISDNEGTILLTLQNQNASLSLDGWINNKLLRLIKHNQDVLDSSQNSFIILDITTNKETDFPFEKYPLLGNSGDSIPIFPSPDMDYAVYFKQGKGAQIILYDLLLDREVRSVFAGNTDITPKWASDSSKVIFSADAIEENGNSNANDNLPCTGLELFQLTIDGVLTRLTCMSSNDFRMNYLVSQGISWSPDLSKISFSVSISTENGYVTKPAILDLTTTKLNIICDEGVAIDWADDSKHLLVMRDEELWLIDIISGFQNHLFDNVLNARWIN